MIDNQFEIIKVLGKGGSSKVFLARDALDNKCAIKVIRKDKECLKYNASAMLQREHDLLWQLNEHPNIIKSLFLNCEGTLESGSESESVMYLALEYARHGALSSFIKYTGCLEEEIARFFAFQVWHAVAYVHSLGFAHLDIKLENILLDEFYNLKLADMGSSVRVIDTNGLSDRRRGTVLYMAPEVASLKSNEVFDAQAADVYSLGVTLFILMSGLFPSTDHSSISTIDSDKSSSFGIEDPAVRDPSKISKEVRYLIQSMTNIDPKKRPTMEEILNSSWMWKEFSENIREQAYLEMNWRKEHMIKLYNKSD